MSSYIIIIIISSSSRGSSSSSSSSSSSIYDILSSRLCAHRSAACPAEGSIIRFVICIYICIYKVYVCINIYIYIYIFIVYIYAYMQAAASAVSFARGALKDAPNRWSTRDFSVWGISLHEGFLCIRDFPL